MTITVKKEDQINRKYHNKSIFHVKLNTVGLYVSKCSNMGSYSYHRQPQSVHHQHVWRKCEFSLSLVCQKTILI